MVRYISDDDRIAQVRLVRPVFQHRFTVRDARERRGTDAAAVGEFLEDAVKHRFDCCENIVLRDEAHFEIELIEFAGASIRTGILVAETRRNLEIAIKPRHHQQLLEHLRRLGEGVEFAGMNTARHQIVACALGAARGQDRRLELSEPLPDHALADAGDDIRAQDDIRVQSLTTQIEIAVFKPDFFGIFGLAKHRHRQFRRRRLHNNIRRAHFDLARRQPGIHRFSGPRNNHTRHCHH